MKFLKQIITITALIIFIIYGCWFWFEQNTHKTFIERKAKVDFLWNEFVSELENRDKYFIVVRKKENLDSIRHFIAISKNERSKDENTFKILQNEYRVNKSMMHYYPNEDIWQIYNELNKREKNIMMP